MHPSYKPLFLLAVFGLTVLGGCTKPESLGLYDPNEPQADTPTITSISPTGAAFAAMDTIVIRGANFSTTLADNIVYFNGSSAVLLSATPTQISLAAPLVTLDSIGVRVAVKGAVRFSNTFQYRLRAGTAVYGGLPSDELSNALATDASGNLYAAYTLLEKDAGISKFTASGVRSRHAPGTTGVNEWRTLKMGPGGYLYAVRNVRAIYQFSPGGGSAAAIWTVPATGIYLSDMDFDKDGNVWTGGNNANIYKVDANKVATAYPFAGNIRALRVFNDYLYFAAKTGAGEKIWRAPITAGALGTAEVYFDFGAAYPTNMPLAITFSSDGVLYIGADSPDGLIIVDANKACTAPYTAYNSLFTNGIEYLAWGNADELYASSKDGLLLKFIVRDKTGAPYFGSTL